MTTKRFFRDRLGDVWQEVESGVLARVFLSGGLGVPTPVDVVEFRWGPLVGLAPLERGSDAESV